MPMLQFIKEALADTLMSMHKPLNTAAPSKKKKNQTHTHANTQNHQDKVKPDRRQMKSHLGDLLLVFIVHFPLESTMLKDPIDRERTMKS